MMIDGEKDGGRSKFVTSQDFDDRLDWTNAMNCRLDSREKALEQLMRLYQDIYKESLKLEEQELQQEKEEEQRRKEKQEQHDAFLLQQQQQQQLNIANATTTKSCKTTTTTSISKSVAVVRGKSGTGKSTLVQQFQQVLSEAKFTSSIAKPYFVTGKYTQENGGQPLSAIVQAFEAFLHQLDGTERQSFKARIQHHVLESDDDDHGILVELLPSLKALLQDHDEVEKSQEITAATSMEDGNKQRLSSESPSADVSTRSNGFLHSLSNDNALNRLIYIFGVFVKAIATKERPLLLFLDDLQWSDGTSRQLLQMLLTDPSLKFVMFVGAIRIAMQQVETDRDEASAVTSDTATGSPADAPAATTDADSDEIMGWLAHLETKTQTIHVGDLSLQELTQFVASALRMGGESANPENDDPLSTLREELVQVIYDKTRGNIFFSKQILEQMYREGFLEFSRVSLQWCWHLDGNLHDFLSNDVLQAVSAKLMSLSPLLQHALTVAAYIRTTFDLDTLYFLLNCTYLGQKRRQNATSTTGTSDSTAEKLANLESLAKLLDSAVLEGLLSNSTGSKKYSFEHDRIQQAAFELVPTGRQRDKFRLDIGHGLLSVASGKRAHSSDIFSFDALGVLSRVPADREWMLFTAADHINASQCEDASSPTATELLTALNYHVGNVAASKAAYETASSYLMLAKQHLQCNCKDVWKTQYDLTLKIFSKLVDVELWRGNFVLARKLSVDILANARTADDRLPTQLALAKAFGREEKHSESLQNAVSALRALRVYPRGPLCKYVGLLKNLLFVKRYFSRKRDDEIVSIPLMTDERYLMAMEFMSVGCYQAYFLGHELEFVCLTLRMLRTTIKHGLCGQSGVALIGFGLFCNNLNDMEGAHRFSSLSRQVLERTKAKHLEPIQLLVVAHWITGWSDPPPKVLSVFERGYRSGMETGDFENALLNMSAVRRMWLGPGRSLKPQSQLILLFLIVQGYHHEYAAGYPLPVLDMKYEQLVQRLQLYKINSVLVMTEEQWRKIRHLMGRNSSGNPLDVRELSKFGPGKKRDGSEKYRLLYGYLCRLELAVYFGDLEFAAKMAVKTLENDSDYSFTTNSLRLFFSGLTYATLARDTNKRHYRRKARRCCKEYKKLCDIKGLNSWHRAMVLEAQLKTLDGKEDGRIEATYDRAVQCALSSGHIQDAGLACQLAAGYFSSLPQQRGSCVECGVTRQSLVTKYADQARHFYRQWGAFGLIEHLEEMYGLDTLPKSLCDAPSTASQSLLASHRSSSTGLPTASGSLVSGIEFSGETSYLSGPDAHREGGLPAVESSDSRRRSSVPLLEEHDNISVMTDPWKDGGNQS
jgi:predicted ATPase